MSGSSEKERPGVQQPKSRLIDRANGRWEPPPGTPGGPPTPSYPQARIEIGVVIDRGRRIPPDIRPQDDGLTKIDDF